MWTSSSSSMGGSLALAAVAFSGSLVVFSLCRAHVSGSSTEPALRPCLSSSDNTRRRERKTAARRVRFADDVVDNEGAPRPARAAPTSGCSGAAEHRMMPANREALYRGMLRGRSAHGVACSY